ncbi:MAG: hypothetical protein PHF21_03490 [Bacilli bacterium]|nr:hypothetical protein [Bacilli bacterium]
MTEEYIKIVNKDIEYCKKLISSGNATERDFYDIVAKYEMEYPNIRRGFTYDPYLSDSSEQNEVSNVKVLLGKLELILAKGKNVEEPINQESNINSYPHININNINNNTNTINIELEFESIIESINKDTHIGRNEKDEIINKVKELEKIAKQKEDKCKKWEKIKPIAIWLFDKGVDVAIQLLPLILQILK